MDTSRSPLVGDMVTDLRLEGKPFNKLFGKPARGGSRDIL